MCGPLATPNSRVTVGALLASEGAADELCLFEGTPRMNLDLYSDRAKQAVQSA
ncbi:MAG: hypothetical protein JWR59_1618, partial [Brevundimonas sp.]|nr:hypothetical protein [Brevundimonas sp.]